MSELKPLEKRSHAVAAILLAVLVVSLGMLVDLGWVGLAPVAVIVGQWAIPAIYRRLKDKRSSGVKVDS